MFGCTVGQSSAPCPMCKRDTRRVFLPGAWTTPRMGIFVAGYDVALGGHVSSKRQQIELARKRGLVRREDVVVRGPRREYPNEDQFMRAVNDLRPSEVLKHREAREKLEFEERSGLKKPETEGKLGG